MEYLKNKTALVTGASKRIGREISIQLAHSGYNVIIHYNQSVDDAKKLCNELIAIGVKAWIMQASFDNPKEYETLIERAFSISPEFSILINNASTFKAEDLKNLHFESIVSSMQINAWAPFALCRQFSEIVPEGKIVNLLDSRTTGFDWNHVGYILSKHMLTILTQMMAIKYAPNITINGIAPGLILPPNGQTLSYLDQKVNSIPLKRHGEPFDIAQAVIYLINAKFVTGSIIYVDGGQHLEEING